MLASILSDILKVEEKLKKKFTKIFKTSMNEETKREWFIQIEGEEYGHRCESEPSYDVDKDIWTYTRIHKNGGKEEYVVPSNRVLTMRSYFLQNDKGSSEL